MKNSLSEKLEVIMDDLRDAVELFNSIAEKAIIDGADQRMVDFVEGRADRSRDESDLLVLVVGDLELVIDGKLQDTIN